MEFEIFLIRTDIQSDNLQNMLSYEHAYVWMHTDCQIQYPKAFKTITISVNISHGTHMSYHLFYD